jgi:hypothetical protein
MVFFPRLPLTAARQVLVRPGIRKRMDVQKLRDAAEPSVVWGSTGAGRVAPDVLAKIDASIRDLARGCGFPKEGGAGARATFDAQVSAWFAATTVIPVSEALRDDVWSWLSIALLPDVCRWRFEGAAVERFLGGRRNTLQRLWTRGRAFDRGAGVEERWKLLEALSEDAMVQITERPSIGADPRLARAIAEAWLATDDGSLTREELMRKAVRTVRIANEVLCFAALEDDAMNAAVREHFTRAAGGVQF